METLNKKYASAAIIIGIIFFALYCDCFSHQIVSLAKDGAWLWFNSQNIILDDNYIFIGCETSKGKSAISSCRLEKDGTVSDCKEFLPGDFNRVDDHNNTSLLKLSNGKLLAVYTKAPENKMYYRMADISSAGNKKKLIWSCQKTADLNYGMSYNNLIRLSDESSKVFNLFSTFGKSPAIITADSNGENWTKGFRFMRQGKNGTSPYVKYMDNGKDRIDILYTDGHPRNEPENNVYHIYYKSGCFYKSDGTYLRSLNECGQKPLAPEEGTLIYDGRNNKPGWVWDIKYDSQGNSVAAFVTSADGAEGMDLRYHYSKYDAAKKQWSQHQIAFAGNHLYTPENHFAGGISLDPENTDVVYLSSNVDPATGKSNITGRYQIFRGKTVDGGNSWKWKQLTYDTDRDNLRPVVPRSHGCKTCVVWFSGKYISSVKFKTEVMGIFER